MISIGFTRATLAQIVARVSADLQARLAAAGIPADAYLPTSPLYALAHAIAGAASSVLGSLDWLARQMWPHTADEAGLALHADVWGVPRTAAQVAHGTVTFTGIAGAAIPAGTPCATLAGVGYTTDALAVVGGGGTVDVAVTSDDTGAAGNSTAGVRLYLSAPVPDVDDVATVAVGGITGGTDIQSVDDWRRDILARVRTVPHGGAVADFALWVREAIDDVESTQVECPFYNVVTVRPTVIGTRATCIPTGPQVAAIQAHIDEVDADGHAVRRPVTMAVTVVAPTPTATVFTLALSVDTPDRRAAVDAAIESLFSRARVAAASIVRLVEIDAAAQGALAYGEFVTRIAPAADVVVAAGAVPTVASIAWV